MKLTDEDKKYILNEFLRNIAHLADEAYQERVWIRAEGPECQDFDDAVCDFFDIGEPILDDYKNFGITDGQHDLLRKFQKEFRTFCHEHYSPKEFITSRGWKKIMESAQEILAIFNYHKKSG